MMAAPLACSKIEALLRALAREEAEKIVARVLGATKSAIYATRPQELWPPGARSMRSARARIRAVPGHAHPERGLWTVSREAYALHHAIRPAPRLRVVAPAGLDDEAIAQRALEAAGLRSTRRAS